MSSTLLGAGNGVEGIVLPDESAAQPEGESGRSVRVTPLRIFGALTVLGAALGGAGLAGYQMADRGPSISLLSGAAHVQPEGYPAANPTQLADIGIVDELRSDYENRLAAMIAQQKRLRTELERAQHRHEEAQRELGRTERALAEASSELDRTSRALSSMQASAEREDEHALGSTEALADAQRKLKDLSMELAAAESAKVGLTRTLETFAGTMEKVIAERDDAAAKAETLDERVAALAEQQDKVLRQIEEAAQMSLGGMRKMFERTGLDLDRILGETREDYTGSGGPFESLAEGSGSGDEPTEIRVAALMSDLEEVNLMRFAAKRLPFGVPVKGVRLTSNFGPRRDPLRRGRAMHKGVDYAGPKGTPIYATGDGVVTFSGVQRGYGRIVTIRHAFGFETRYAHLNRSRVKVGERVERGDHIGDMGNTGRSTGTHLHYEVRIDREAVNPANFVEAAHNVL